MPYNYYYAVKDDYTYADFSAQEQSDDKGHVTGSYRVALPDGRTQIVYYKADDYGYNADVKYEGEAYYPEYAPTYKANNYAKQEYAPYQSYSKKSSYPEIKSY